MRRARPRWAASAGWAKAERSARRSTPGLSEISTIALSTASAPPTTLGGAKSLIRFISPIRRRSSSFRTISSWVYAFSTKLEALNAPETARSYIDTFAAAARRSAKPHYLLTTRPGVMDRALVGVLREHGVAAVGGLREGLMAIDRLARNAK
jgi:hypothetical protein